MTNDDDIERTETIRRLENENHELREALEQHHIFSARGRKCLICGASRSIDALLGAVGDARQEAREQRAEWQQRNRIP